MSALARLVALAALLAAPTALAFTDIPELTDRQVEQFRDLSRRAGRALSGDSAQQAVRLYRRALRIHDGNEGTWYNLACAEARRGQTALALDALANAGAAGWADAQWPAQDSDLASLHETVAFRDWVASLEEGNAASATWPAVDDATLAADGDEIAEIGDARAAAIRRVSAVIGSNATSALQLELTAWKAASWERVAAGRSSPSHAAEARHEALRVIAGRDATRLSALAADRVVDRATSLAATLPPSSDLLPDVRLLGAEARFAAANRAAPDAEARRAASAAFERELLVLAAVHEPGPAVERALARLFSLAGAEGDLDTAALLQGRLLQTADDEAEARRALVGRDRGTYYRLNGLPAFEARTTDGTLVTPQSLRGRVTLIDFWATWCGPCRAELPHVKAAYEELHDRGFEILGVSLDNESDKDLEGFLAWCEEQGMPWPQVYDGKGWSAELAETFGVRSIPFPLLVGADGSVVATDGALRGEGLLETVRQALDSADTTAGLSGQ